MGPILLHNTPLGISQGLVSSLSYSFSRVLDVSFNEAQGLVGDFGLYLGFHSSFGEIFTPNYLASLVFFRLCPIKMYEDSWGLNFLVIIMVSHLSG